LNPTTLNPGLIFNSLKPQITQTPTTNRPQSIFSSQDLARKAITMASTYLNTPEGRTEYLAAMQAWEAVYPAAREADFTTTPYPLTPGTAPLGSRECYACGVIGHITRDHDPIVPQINLREQRWRALIGQSLFTRYRMDFSPISQITMQNRETLSYDPTMYNTAQQFNEDYEEQENSEEVHE
jgi:hypothetical protein